MVLGPLDRQPDIPEKAAPAPMFLTWAFIPTAKKSATRTGNNLVFIPLKDFVDWLVMPQI